MALHMHSSTPHQAQNQGARGQAAPLCRGHESERCSLLLTSCHPNTATCSKHSKAVNAASCSDTAWLQGNLKEIKGGLDSSRALAFSVQEGVGQSYETVQKSLDGGREYKLLCKWWSVKQQRTKTQTVLLGIRKNPCLLIMPSLCDDIPV